MSIESDVQSNGVVARENQRDIKNLWKVVNRMDARQLMFMGIIAPMLAAATVGIWMIVINRSA
jgi:hypothetical protein